MAKLSLVHWSRTRVWRTLAFLGADVLVFALSLYLAFLVRFDGHIPSPYISIFLQVLPIAVAIKISALAFFRMYRFSWSYVGMDELYNTLFACAAGSLAFAAMLFLLRHWPAAAGVPRSILGVDFAFSLIGIGGIRLSKRAFLHALLHVLKPHQQKGRRTLFVGAGDAGAQLVHALQEERESPFLPVGFVDDDPGKQGLVIHGVPVLGPRSRLPELIRARKAEAVIIAMPSASSRVIRETVELVRKGDATEVKIIPFLSELYSGEVRTSDVREVLPEDVLGRDPVSIDTEIIERSLRDKRVLVTGASGSIGSELCRQILRFGVEKLLAFDIDETGLFNLEKDLHRRFPGSNLEVIIGDVRDRERVNALFRKYQPQVVFHAAAYKHVPLMESFPQEAVRTNVFGTKTMVEEACRSGAESFVLISTDKAVNPTSVMGATKRVAEMIVRLQDSASSTRCMAVRFGNVLGSRGSVLPIFMEQIRRGGPVTVTHPEMRRYFMVTSEAVLLVLQAGAMGKGGEVFVLDMGKPVNILDLAKDLIRFHGLEPDRDIPIVFTGIRPGEKLYEELLTAEEGTEATTHERIFTARMRTPMSQEEMGQVLEQLSRVAADGKRDEIISVLKELIDTYHPFSEREVS